jgi:hypothetical protein
MIKAALLGATFLAAAAVSANAADVYEPAEAVTRMTQLIIRRSHGPAFMQALMQALHSTTPKMQMKFSPAESRLATIGRSMAHGSLALKLTTASSMPNSLTTWRRSVDASAMRSTISLYTALVV